MDVNLNKLRDLVSRQRAIERKMADLSTRAEQLIEALPTEISTLRTGLNRAVEGADALAVNLTQTTRERLAEMDKKAGEISIQCSSRIEEIADLDVNLFAQGASTAAEEAVNKLQADATSEFETLFDTTMDAGWNALDSARESLEDAWNDTSQAVADIVTDGETTLEAIKSNLEASFEEFTEIEIDQVLEEAAQSMVEIFGGTVSDIFDRAEALHERVMTMSERLQAIMEIFVRARKAKDMAQTSAGTGLETVSSILEGFTEVLDEV